MMDESASSQTVTQSKVGRKKRKIATVEGTENDGALCGRQISTRSKTKVNTDNKDSDDMPTTPSSTTSSKSGRSGKRNKIQTPVSNDVSTSGSHLSTIECEANAPVTSLAIIPSKSVTRSKKLQKTDVFNDINILEPKLSTFETKKPVPETSSGSTTISSKSGKGNKKLQKVSVQSEVNISEPNVTIIEMQTGVAETRDVKNNKKKRGRPTKIITNNCVNEPVKNSEVSVLKTCNLIPTVKIEQLSFNDCMKLYKMSEQSLNPGPSREEKLDNSNTSNTQKSSDFLKSQVKMKKRKFQGLLSDTVVHNLRRKMAKNQLRKPTKSPSNSELNLYTTTNTNRTEESSLLSKSPQYSALGNALPLTQVDNGLDDPEQFSKILRHTHASIKPISIKINIDSRKQERVVEFAKPVDKPISNEDRNMNSATFECNFSDSSSFTNTPMPYAEYYCVYNDWSYNINEESLFKIVSDNILFTNSELSSAVDCQLKSVVENSKTQDDVISSHSSFESTSATSDFQFVKPCKRPPTRHRTSKSSTCEGSCNSVTDISTPNDISYIDHPAVDDDIISIYSHWSIRSKDFTQSTTPASRSSATNQEGVTPSPNPIQRELQVDIPSKSNSTSYVAQWVEEAQMFRNHINKRFNYVPAVFKKLCYIMITQGCCRRTKCKFVHNRDVLNNFNLVQLRDSFEYAKIKEKIFIHIISSFINEFAKRNSSVDLVSMVRAVIIPENSKQVLHVQEIICALLQTGYTYETAMEELMMCYRDNFDILNILLKIVFENETNLCNNWGLVQKLCEYRNYAPIEPALVNRVMGYCYRIYNIDLCVKLVEDIFKRDLVNPQHISEFHFARLITLLKRHNLKEAEVLVHIVQTNNIPINFAIDNGIPSLLSLSTNCNNISPRMSPSQITYDTNSNVNNFNFNHIQQSDTETNTNNGNLCWTTNNFSAAKDPVCQTSSNINGDYNYNSSNSETDTMKDCGDEEFDIEDLNNEDPHNIPGSRECNKMQKTLSDFEIKKLNRVISCDDHETLIAMYNDYKNVSNSNSFVLNVVGFFKKKNPPFIINLVEKFLVGLEKQSPGFPYLPHAEATLYSLVLNTIGILKQLKGFTEAATLLNKFRDCLENLTKVHWFRSVHTHPFTIIGKYLYFCKIFTRGKFYSSTLHILKSPELQLLHSSTKWNLPHMKTFDEKFRNKVLHDFITATLQDNLDVAKDIILYIMMMTNEDIATEIDSSKYFDKLILAMLNNNKIEHLIEMLPNILRWYKYLKIQNMKALLITLVKKRAPESQLVTLYSKCCQQGIYPQLKGNETIVSLTTDMKAEEIFITLRYFFAKLFKKNFQIQEILISIKMPQQLHDKPTILIDSQCGITEMKERTLTVLTNCFPSIIIVQICGNDIKVKADQLKLCMESYRKSHSRGFWARQSSVDRMDPCKY